jgi:chromosome segregation ATPase
VLQNNIRLTSAGIE